MKKHTLTHLAAYFVATALLALTLCSCQNQSTFSTSEQAPENLMNDVYRQVSAYSVQPLDSVPHGEDYVIQWQDAGMEAHIRFLLGREEGDIRHSDVWDIQVLNLLPGSGAKSDIMLQAPPDGSDTFTYESVRLNKEVWQEYKTYQTFPAIESLKDLCHFDSLQVFELTPHIAGSVSDSTLDLSGVDQCPNLKVLGLDTARPLTLEPLAHAARLENLSLTNCGTLDLEPLKGLDNLSVLTLSGSDLLTLEPLSQLPSLKVLGLRSDAKYPSLAPLAGTSLEYLDMSTSQSGSTLYDDLDYTPLTQLPRLVYLNVSNHPKFDAALCNEILKASPDMKYLNIAKTAAAEDVDQINGDGLEIFVKSLSFPA